MMLMTMPVLYPVAVTLNMDPVWFGIVTVVLIELGQITPPVGINLFVIRAFDSALPHRSVVKAALPYVGLMIALIVALAAFPDLALWLADRTAKGP
jgi:C4-dicarboxylate transporter, DctM subunit